MTIAKNLTLFLCSRATIFCSPPAVQPTSSTFWIPPSEATGCGGCDGDKQHRLHRGGEELDQGWDAARLDYGHFVVWFHCALGGLKVVGD